MANRSMLFAASGLPEADGPPPQTLGLAEFRSDIPLVFKALLSPAPQACRSLIFDPGHPIAIAGDMTAGLERLRALQTALGPNHPNAKAMDAGIAFLSKPQVAAFPFLILEPGEILELEGDPLTDSFPRLVAEIAALSPDALLAAARAKDPETWGRDCWTHVLYFEPAGSVRPDLDPTQTSLFSDPDHLLASAAGLGACTKLARIDLSFTEVDSRLDAAIAALAAVPQPFGLTLSGRLSRLPDPVSALTQLKWLGAGQAGLTALPDAFASSACLDTLYLQSNRFSELPSVLRTLKGLKNLSIWGNPLRRLPDWIGELTSLESLLVNGCDLDALPDSLFALPTLRELDISENPRLTRLPEQIGDLKALENLKAYRCGLDSLPDSLGRLPRLKELFIAENRLTALPRSVRQARLEMLSLAGNPIRIGFFGPRFRARKIYWR
jgi:hypothetical protein